MKYNYLQKGIEDLITWIKKSPKRDFRYEIDLEIDSVLTPLTWSRKEI
jgi:hypothetical protein